MGERVFDVVTTQALSLTGMGRMMLDAVMDPAVSDAGFKAQRADARRRSCPTLTNFPYICILGFNLRDYFSHTRNVTVANR
ncbi:hypothetical protein ACRAWD_23010 [Caulobacter segnis]